MAEILVECLGDMCPVPVVRLKVALKRARPGDVVLLRTDHSCTMKSLPELLRRTGYAVAVQEVAAGVWEVRVAVPVSSPG